MNSYRLMTPGPVPLPNDVLESLALPMEHHRTPEFQVVFKRVLGNLKKVFETQRPVFIQTCTGSGGMESALVNCLSPGDRVIAVISGKFGERWADMAETFGMQVTRIEVPWGEAVRLEKVEEALAQYPKARALLCQACETSTAVLHPVREIARLLAKTETLFMVDAITAMGALPMPMDEWGLDVVVAGSQKAFMLPAGLAFISLSEKAWARTATAKCPRFYFDLRSELEANEAGDSLFSAAVTHIRALDLVLASFLDRGLHKVHARIQSLAAATIACAREMGLEPFAKVPSPSVTAIAMPLGIDGQKVRAEMEKFSKIVVMGGQDQLKGKIIRIGHMGAISDEDLLETMKALAESLNRQKAETISNAHLEAGLRSAQQILTQAPAR